jgi:filamentous hemagglutinin family protein
MKALIVSVLGILLLPKIAWAQSVIVPDDSLGAERSEVTQNAQGLPVEEIGGGAQRGQNLFHSFREFNVDAGRGAYFAIPNFDIRNVLTRVTGGNGSNIQGTIGTVSPGGVRVPNVNLFLINPNGITFGENASLDVGASFFATTASGVQLGDGVFSATQPEQPTDVLTVDPSAFLFGSNTPGSINVRSRNTQLNFGSQTVGLQVPNGETLFLLGGDVVIDGGRLNAYGGRVEIGAVEADITFTNASQVDVSLDQGGDVTLTARNIGLLGSSVKAGIDSGRGVKGNRAGDIYLNASGEVRLERESAIANSVFQDAIGNGGNLIINANSLFVTSGSQLTSATIGQGDAGDVSISAGSLIVTDGAQLNSSTFGQGDAGDISITVRDTATFDGRSSSAGSIVDRTAVGKGGTLSLSAGSLIVTDGAQLNSSTFGQGDAGDISITVRDTATFDSEGAAGSTVQPTAIGKGGTLSLSAGSLIVTNGAQLTSSTSGQGDAGDVSISAGSLIVTDGAQLNSSTFGQGDAGDISITVRDTATFDGRSSSAGSIVDRTAVGKGGTLSLSAGSLIVTDGAQLNSSTFGQGDAGDISITVRDTATFDSESFAGSTVGPTAIGKGGTLSLSAGSLIVTNGARLTSNTAGQGDAGNVTITVRDAATFDAVGKNGSGAGSQVNPGAVGNGGTLTLFAGSLSVTNGASLSSSTFGQGDAGSVTITARDRALFQGTNANGLNPSNASSSVETGGEGKGGNVVITAPLLEVRDGAVLVASTDGKGDAGNVQITAGDRVLFQNLSGAFSSVETGGEGEGGNVVITAPLLEVRDGAQLVASTDGKGDAGNVQIIAGDRVLFQGTNANRRSPSGAFSSVDTSGAGKGGNIVIEAPVLEVLDGAQLLAATLGKGDAGNVLITASNRVLFQGANANGRSPSAAASSVVAGGLGTGGNIVIDAPVLEVRDGAQLLADTNGTGDAGNVQITAGDRVLLDGFTPATGNSSSIFTKNGIPNTSNIGTGKGGNVILTTPQLTLSNSAVIDASTANDKPGGDITLNLTQLSLLGGSQILTTSDGSGTAGTLNLTATDQVLISGTDPTYTDRLTQFSTAVAPIEANSGIYARANSTGAAGNLNLTTTRLTLDQRGRIDTQSTSVDGGNINITVPRLLLLRNNSQISTNAGRANSEALGDGGNININARLIVAIPKEDSDITANATKGRGGNVIINTQGIFGLKKQNELTPFSDITASSEVFGLTGNITLNTPDNSAIQNNLSQLSTDNINPEQLIAKTCIVRQNDIQGSFAITGNTNLPNSPGTIAPSTYATATIQTTEPIAKSDRPWKIGDPIVEPQGFYKLADGRLVMGRECPR